MFWARCLLHASTCALVLTNRQGKPWHCSRCQTTPPNPCLAGIDPERFTAALEAEEVQMNIAKLLNRCGGK